MKQIIFLLALGCCIQYANAQKNYNGYIITHNNDTVSSQIFSPNELPKKIKRRSQAYFHNYIVVKRNDNDQERILTPTDIKGFYFNFVTNNVTTPYHGTLYALNTNYDLLFKKNSPDLKNIFVRKLIFTGYYHLFYFEEIDVADGTVDKCFILYNTATNTSSIFFRTNQLIKLLNWPTQKEQLNNPRYKDWFMGKQNLVIDYNQYIASKKEK